MDQIDGVDFSAHEPGKPGSAALRAANKQFVCTYLARETDWRVMTPNELRELVAGGIDIVANYEADTETWRGGFQTGVDHARYAQEHLARLGLPPSQPIYFSIDYDASPEDQAVIDDYLHGCASVVGADRVGVYGGFYIVRRCHENGSARWLWQTSAWSGGQIFPAAHLYQYDYGHVINGVECDDTRALQPHYGQASDFRGTPTTTTTPGPVPLPKGMSASLATKLFNPDRVVRPDTGGVVAFGRGGAVTEEWIRHGAESIPPGKTWRAGRWPKLTQVVRRGDGRLDYVFSDGFVYERATP